MSAESEVDAMVIIVDTGKFKDLASKLNVEPDGVAVVDAALDAWGLLDIYHRGYGWIEKQLFKRDEKKVKAKNEK